MAQYYTDKQTIINLILTEQPELKLLDNFIDLWSQPEINTQRR